MGTSNIAALRFPAATGIPPNVPLHMDQLTQDLDPQVVTKYTTSATRNSTYNGLSASQRRGSVCWTVDRGGHGYFDPTTDDWEYLGVNRLLYSGVQSGTGGEQASTDPVGILDMPPVALPPGNRLISVSIKCTVTNIGMPGSGTATTASPRLFTSGPTLRDQRHMFAGTVDITMRINEEFIASGTLDMFLSGLNTFAGALRWSGATMLVIDKGPVA